MSIYDKYTSYRWYATFWESIIWNWRFRNENAQNDMNDTNNVDIVNEFIEKVSNLLHPQVNIVQLWVLNIIENTVGYITKYLIGKEKFDSLKRLLVRIRRRLLNETWVTLLVLIVLCIDVYIFVAYLIVSVIDSMHLFAVLWKQ